MLWLWIPLALVLAVVIGLYLFHLHIFRTYLPYVGRIFQEKPLFIVPFGKPAADAEEVEVVSSGGLKLHGCYLRAPGPRRGVILFGLEFGSTCWSCIPYCESLREQGYDIFAVETRGQGQSPAQPGYEPLQWVTDFEVEDFRAALDYLKKRPDADPRGIGFFGLSKGAGAGVLVAAEDPYIRCCVTDGLFALYTTMVPYMRKWITIYSRREWIAKILPVCYFEYAARTGLRGIEEERHCTFPRLEKVMSRIAPRPLLMIHGGADNYIKPVMAQELFDLARDPKELWIVDNAKHNQAIQQATEEYKARVVAFFNQHLSEPTVTPVSAPISPPAEADRFFPEDKTLKALASADVLR